MDEPRLKSMEATEDGGLRMCFAPGPMLQLWAAEMSKLLKDHNDAPNYVECLFTDMETGQPWILHVQKADGFTPAQKAEMAENRATRLRAMVTPVLTKMAGHRLMQVANPARELLNALSRLDPQGKEESR